MPSIRLASNLQRDSIVDGPGLRMVLWTQGCPHNCVNCHNPQTHDPYAGMEVEVETIIEEIKQIRLQSGLTLSGGEPFQQSSSLIPIVEFVKKEMHLNVWAYSGYTFEELMQDEEKKALLTKIDVLVDGRFIDELKDYRLRFKGSKNQRIIDVQKSLQEHKVILSHYDDCNLNLEDDIKG